MVDNVFDGKLIERKKERKKKKPKAISFLLRE